MTSAELERILAAMRTHQVHKLDLRVGKTAYSLTLAGGALPVVRAAPAPRTVPVPSPAIGRLHPRGLGDGLQPLAQGDPVRAGDPLGYVQLGAVLHVILSPSAGVLVTDLPERGRILGFGDTVVSIKETQG